MEINSVFMVYVIGAVITLVVVGLLLWIRMKPEFSIAYLEQIEQGRMLGYNPDKETPNHVYSDNGYRFRKMSPKYVFRRGAIKRITLLLARAGTMWTFKVGQPNTKLSAYEALQDIWGKDGDNWIVDTLEEPQLSQVKASEIKFTVGFEENKYDFNLPEQTSFDEPNEHMAILIGRSIKKALQTNARDIIRDLALMGAGVTAWNLLQELGLM